MQYNVARLTEALEAELSALFTAYYSVTPAHTGQPPYDFNWAVFRAVQDANMLLITVARDEDNSLCGAALYIITEHSHHRGWIIAECDTLAVDHNKRGKGIGRGLYAYTETQLRDRGVKLITNRFRVCYDVEPLFPKLGFKLAEQVYMKEI
jgi:GNAT superfamily N-acetyltransferase